MTGHFLNLQKKIHLILIFTVNPTTTRKVFLCLFFFLLSHKLEMHATTFDPIKAKDRKSFCINV